MTDVMTIREMCQVFDVTPRTLRFYEQKELLFPIRQGTKRHFTRRDRARMKLILRGKRFGFALEDIRQLLDLYDREDGRLAQITRSCEIARARLAAMTDQRTELEGAIAELKDQLAWGEEMITSHRKPGTSRPDNGGTTRNAELCRPREGHAVSAA